MNSSIQRVLHVWCCLQLAQRELDNDTTIDCWSVFGAEELCSRHATLSKSKCPFGTSGLQNRLKRTP